PDPSRKTVRSRTQPGSCNGLLGLWGLPEYNTRPSPLQPKGAGYRHGTGSVWVCEGMGVWVWNGVRPWAFGFGGSDTHTHTPTQQFRRSPPARRPSGSAP